MGSWPPPLRLAARACIQNKEMGKRVHSMSGLFLSVFINTVLEYGGQIH
jgi:hypothetical protein